MQRGSSLCVGKQDKHILTDSLILEQYNSEND